MPPGSFLTKPVGSPSELANLVQTDKVVAQRFSKHFGMDPSSLAEYFRDNLKLTTLAKSGQYRVYFITKGGKITLHKKRLKAGTKMFVAWNGQLILEGRCGNPMTKTLPQRPKVSVVPEPPPTTPLAPTAVVEPVQVEIPPLAPEPEVEVLAEPPIELVTAPAARWLLPALLGAGAIGALGGGGGGEPVPEPTGLLVLSLGGASLFFYSCKRRR